MTITEKDIDREIELYKDEHRIYINLCKANIDLGIYKQKTLDNFAHFYQAVENIEEITLADNEKKSAHGPFIIIAKKDLGNYSNVTLPKLKKEMDLGELLANIKTDIESLKRCNEAIRAVNNKNTKSKMRRSSCFVAVHPETQIATYKTDSSSTPITEEEDIDQDQILHQLLNLIPEITENISDEEEQLVEEEQLSTANEQAIDNNQTTKKDETIEPNKPIITTPDGENSKNGENTKNTKKKKFTIINLGADSEGEYNEYDGDSESADEELLKKNKKEDGTTDNKTSKDVMNKPSKFSYTHKLFLAAALLSSIATIIIQSIADFSIKSILFPLSLFFAGLALIFFAKIFILRSHQINYETSGDYRKIDELKNNTIYKKAIIAGIFCTIGTLLGVATTLVISQSLFSPTIQLIASGMGLLAGIFMGIGAVFTIIYANQKNNLDYYFIQEQSLLNVNGISNNDNNDITINNDGLTNKKVLLTFFDFSEVIYQTQII